MGLLPVGNIASDLTRAYPKNVGRDTEDVGRNLRKRVVGN